MNVSNSVTRVMWLARSEDSENGSNLFTAELWDSLSQFPITITQTHLSGFYPLRGLFSLNGRSEHGRQKGRWPDQSLEVPEGDVDGDFIKGKGQATNESTRKSQHTRQDDQRRNLQREILLTDTEVRLDLGPKSHGPFSLRKYWLETGNLGNKRQRQKQREEGKRLVR